MAKAAISKENKSKWRNNNKSIMKWRNGNNAMAIISGNENINNGSENISAENNHQQYGEIMKKQQNNNISHQQQIKMLISAANINIENENNIKRNNQRMKCNVSYGNAASMNIEAAAQRRNGGQRRRKRENSVAK